MKIWEYAGFSKEESEKLPTSFHDELVPVNPLNLTDVDITSLPAQDVEELTYFAGYLKHRYANFEDHVKKTNLIKMIQRLDDVEPQQENINISDAIEAIYIGGSQQKKID